MTVLEQALSKHEITSPFSWLMKEPTALTAVARSPSSKSLAAVSNVLISLACCAKVSDRASRISSALTHR